MSWPAFEAGVLFGDGVVSAHFMPPERGVNIDTELDFAVAEMLLERNKL
jgi:CMP-N-acetylneuraminic acid synthetase